MVRKADSRGSEQVTRKTLGIYHMKEKRRCLASASQGRGFGIAEEEEKGFQGESSSSANEPHPAEQPLVLRIWPAGCKMRQRQPASNSEANDEAPGDGRRLGGGCPWLYSARATVRCGRRAMGKGQQVVVAGSAAVMEQLSVEVFQHEDELYVRLSGKVVPFLPREVRDVRTYRQAGSAA